MLIVYQREGHHGKVQRRNEGKYQPVFMERAIKAELDKDPEQKGYSVLVHIDKIHCYGGDQVFQER